MEGMGEVDRINISRQLQVEFTKLGGEDRTKKRGIVGTSERRKTTRRHYGRWYREVNDATVKDKGKRGPSTPRLPVPVKQ